ncbi:MAG: amidoligase [Clostridiales bacterium]|nr:amidoligase [Clostridiales bacterium]
MRNQRFGIEIEFTGITREIAANEIASYYKTENYYIGGAYRTYEVRDNKSRTWKIMSDSSIIAEQKFCDKKISADSNFKVELVSPILTYDDIDDLQGIVRKLRKAGAFINKSCGIHVHIDAKAHTPSSLKNLVNIIASKENMIYKTLDIPYERLRYCKKVNEKLIEKINSKKPKTISELADIWYEDYGVQSRTAHYNNSRYHGLNLHSTFTKGTVEFRIFNSTLHAGKIKAYIQFCLAVSYQALIQKKASSKRTITDNEKYAFRCWMLRLGLIGDEFKTCRYHFLKNLEGNSAWRHAV